MSNLPPPAPFPTCERCARLIREEAAAENPVAASERFDVLMRHLVRDHGLPKMVARRALGIHA